MAIPILPQMKGGGSPLLPPSGTFPPNVAASTDPATLLRMTRYMYSEYILPQIMERQPYEPLWDLLLEMYKMKLKTDKLRLPQTQQPESTQDREAINMTRDGNQKAQVSDSVVYDAVDRLKNLNHFISWKDGSPISFQAPRTADLSGEDQFYFPTADKYKSYNGLLEWNIRNQEIYRKHLILCQHHYLYGMSFVNSAFTYQAQIVQQQNNQGQMVQNQQIMDIGVTFEPISIRRIWLNYRVPIYEMKMQQCPFFFEQQNRFAILQSPYDPTNNPFGYVNLDKLSPGQWLFTAQEMQEARKGLEARLQAGSATYNLSEILKPERSVEALWTFYPMLPFDDQTGEFETRQDGKTPVPFKRFIWQAFANNLLSGDMTPIKVQRNFYPNDDLPLYGSQHMPDLDSGLYSPAIGEVLENHYKELCTAQNQYIDNKNLINNPPTWVVIGSPSSNVDRNVPGADIKVTGPNDVGWRQVYDGTQTTRAFCDMIREQAQTSSKAVDAILGKALGGRTSATEASNVFQAAMSGVTTDINVFNYDIMGGYADRVWLYTGQWFSPDLLKMVTGMYGPSLMPEDLWARVDKKWDIGSTYIESIVKQGNIRYMLEASVNSPVLDQATLWRLLFEEFRMPEAISAIRDDGFSDFVQEATEMVIKIYLGQPVLPDPALDPNIAINVMTRFLKDQNSKWNQEYGALPCAQNSKQSRVQFIAEQIQFYQKLAILQMQQQAAQMQLQVASEDKKQQVGQRSLPSETAAQTAGQLNQQQPSNGQ